MWRLEALEPLDYSYFGWLVNYNFFFVILVNFPRYKLKKKLHIV